jgi:hypothetical protein
MLAVSQALTGMCTTLNQTDIKSWINCRIAKQCQHTKNALQYRGLWIKQTKTCQTKLPKIAEIEAETIGFQQKLRTKCGTLRRNTKSNRDWSRGNLDKKHPMQCTRVSEWKEAKKMAVSNWKQKQGSKQSKSTQTVAKKLPKVGTTIWKESLPKQWVNESNGANPATNGWLEL